MCNNDPRINSDDGLPIHRLETPNDVGGEGAKNADSVLILFESVEGHWARESRSVYKRNGHLPDSRPFRRESQ